MKEIFCKITENKRIAERTYEMKLGEMSESHGISRAGQFVNIRLDGFFLRRPISVCCCDDESITLIYKTVGRGTEAMSEYTVGQELSILTPLGNGFDIEVLKDVADGKYGTNIIAAEKSGEESCSDVTAGKSGKESGKDVTAGGSGSKAIRPALIGGGVGVPPMYGLCKSLNEQGIEPLVVLGFNNSAEIFYKEKFEALKADVRLATADGSMGAKGFVTDVLKNESFGYFFACGPMAMLKAIDDETDRKIGGQLSFEERMGCGFGACMGCSCETKYGYKRICKDGPVLERGEIIW